MRIALYVRVSTEHQEDGYSIPAQISTLQQYCVANNYIVQKIYTDSGISGKNIKDRPALLELIEDAKNKQFDSVLVWKLSRLSRSLLDLLNIVDQLSNYNISFQSFSEKFDTGTPLGKMLLQLLGSIAEFERNTIVENVKMGLNERFRQGMQKGSVPFGYRSENKKAVIVQDEAEIVQRIFVSYDENTSGDCISDLAEYLHKETGRSPKRDSIRWILSNPFYAGYVRTGIHPNGRLIRGDNPQVSAGIHDAIIDKDLFDRVQQKLESKRHKPIRYPDNPCNLTGLIICPHCQGHLIAHCSQQKHTSANGSIATYQVYQYRCKNREQHRIKCIGFSIVAHRVNDPVRKIIQELAHNSDVGKMVERAQKELDKQGANKGLTMDKLKSLERQLKEACSTRDRYYKLFETGKVDVELFAGKINDILKKVSEIEKEISEERKKVEVKNTVAPELHVHKLNNFVDNYDKLSNAERKEFYREVVEKILINADKKDLKLEIYFKMGLKIYYP